MSKDQRFLLLVFIGIMALWLTDRWHHIHSAIIFRRGIVLGIIGILILSFGIIWIWQCLGVVTFQTLSREALPQNRCILASIIP